jgi:hypothetical protein
MRRTVLASCLTAAALLGVTAIATPAGAAGPARIAGKHSTFLAVTKVVNIFGERVTSGTRTWTFTPHCSTGACTTTLKRPSVERSVTFTETLVPQANGTYLEVQHFIADCVSNTTGAVIAKNAYTDVYTFTLTPTKIAGGVVTAYKGGFRSVYTRKPTAPASCGPAEEDASFHSP